MARVVESEKCDAWVAMGDASSGAMLPCRKWGEGFCLKDARLDSGHFKNVEVVSGTCRADSDAGIPPESGTPDIVKEIREKGGLGTNIAFDFIVDPEKDIKDDPEHK